MQLSARREEEDEEEKKMKRDERKRRMRKEEENKERERDKGEETLPGLTLCMSLQEKNQCRSAETGLRKSWLSA